MKSTSPTLYFAFKSYSPNRLETYPAQYKVYQPGLTTFAEPERSSTAVTQVEEI